MAMTPSLKWTLAAASALVVCIVLFVVFALTFTRWPEASQEATLKKIKIVQSELDDMKREIDATIAAGKRLPPLMPLSEFEKPKLLRMQNGEDAMTFGWAFSQSRRGDPYSLGAGVPYAAQTSGTLYIIYSPGPGSTFDFEPPALQEAFNQKSTASLSWYDPKYYLHGDIFATNIPAGENEQTEKSAAVEK
ncbi:hypothetical protein BH09SUM1_BH09SUM1_10860 [soil metagenome]